MILVASVVRRTHQILVRSRHNERRTLGHNKQGQDEHPKVIADGPDSGRRSIRTERQEELVIILSARKYPQPTLFSFYLRHQPIMMI